MSCRITTDPEEAAAVIRAGGVVALPTETVYGLGGDATNPRAVARIFSAKGRPAFDPLIVHLAESADLPRVARDVPARALQLGERFWPGPLTLVLPKQPTVADLVTSGLPTVGVRVPRHPLMHAVLKSSGVPIAAPSANRFGCLSPTRAEHVLEQLGDAIDLILDGGLCTVGVESTIVQVAATGAATVLRPGGLAVEDLATIVDSIDIATGSTDRPTAPGMLASHYAPRTPLVLLATASEPPRGTRWGWLGPAGSEPRGFVCVEPLPADAQWTLAAAELFAALHRLDHAGLEQIVAAPFPEVGLGRAINDRLRRAASTS